MNLSVEWIPLLKQAGWSAVHWSAVGDPRAEDETIMAWALTNGHVVFSHDLDFGTTLALVTQGEPLYVTRESSVQPTVLPLRQRQVPLWERI